MFQPCSHDDLDTTGYALSKVVGFINGNSAMGLVDDYSEYRRNRARFRARGYVVLTVGSDEEVICNNIRNEVLNGRVASAPSTAPLATKMLKSAALPWIFEKAKILDRAARHVDVR